MCNMDADGYQLQKNGEISIPRQLYILREFQLSVGYTQKTKHDFQAM